MEPDVLQLGTVTISGFRDCRRCYRRLVGEQVIFRGMLCAGTCDDSNVVDACQGDSGGPMTIKNSDGFFEIYGVVIFGIGCAGPVRMAGVCLQPALCSLQYLVFTYSHSAFFCQFKRHMVFYDMEALPLQTL